MNWDRTYAAIDLKSFYASVECVERGLNPLATNLVVADDSRTDKTICLAVTPSLKKYGLSGRSRLFEVKQKVAQIKNETGVNLEYIIAVPRMALYIKYSADIYDIYLKYFSPEDIHIYSIDEVFIDLTTYLPFYNTDAFSLCKKVVDDIFDSTGITATVGIAPNLFLCKVTMDIVAKHLPSDERGVKIAILDEMEFRQKLWNHKPLTDFWRIGKGTQTRLNKNMMFTLGDVARRSCTKEGESQLYKIFGIDAEILIDHAWGIEPCTIKHIKNYKSQAKSLGSGQVLHCAYSVQNARTIVKEMTERLVIDLLEKKLVASSFTLCVGFDILCLENKEFKGEVVTDFYGRQIPKGVHGTVSFIESTNSSAKILDGILLLFDRIVDSSLLVRRLNICANDVILQANVQPSLFDKTEEDNTESKLQQTVLHIHKKFGKNALLKAYDFEECATARQRNAQIGGHKA